MHPLYYYGFNQNPWKTAPTRGEVARYFYGRKIPFGAPDSSYRVKETYRYSALSGLGDLSVVPGVSFKSTAAGNDFLYPYGQNGGCDGRHPWPGFPPNVLADISSHLADLDAAGVPLDSWRAKANSLVSQLQQLEQHNNLIGCGRSDEREDQYYTAKLALQQHLRSALNIPLPPPSPSGGSSSSSSGQKSSGGGGSGAGSGGSGSATGPAFPVLPVALGVLGLGVAAYFFLRK